MIAPFGELGSDLACLLEPVRSGQRVAEGERSEQSANGVDRVLHRDFGVLERLIDFALDRRDARSEAVSEAVCGINSDRSRCEPPRRLAVTSHRKHPTGPELQS